MLVNNSPTITYPLEGVPPTTFIQRLQRLFFGKEPSRTTHTGISTSLLGLGDPRTKLFTLRRTRESVLRDAAEMQNNDPRWASVLDAIARDATLGGFAFCFHNEGRLRRPKGVPQAQRILEAFTKQSGLMDKLEGWTRALIRDGDLFTELIVEEETQKPVGVKKLDTRITVPAVNEKGGWIYGPERAYYQTDGTTENAKTWFAEWQIVHAKWGADEGDIFGTSQLKAGRKAWQMLVKSEEDLVLRRRLRTGLRFLHTIDGTPQDLARYREENKQTFENPFEVQSDIFVNSKATVTELTGDVAVDRIADVVHLLHTLFVRGQFPKALLGYEQDINRDVLREQMEQYTKFLRTVSWRMGICLREIFRRVLLFNGIDDDGVGYDIRWRWRSDEELRDTTDVAIKLRATGLLSAETFFSMLDMPGITWEAEKAKIEKELKAFPHLAYTLRTVPVLMDNPQGISGQLRGEPETGGVTGQLRGRQVPGGEPTRVRIPRHLGSEPEDD